MMLKKAIRLLSLSLLLCCTVQYAAHAQENTLTNQTYYDQQRWSLTGFYGWTSGEVLGHVLTGNFNKTGEQLNSLEASYLLAPNNGFRYFFHPLVDTVELAANITRRYGGGDEKTIYEFNPYVLFRWVNFPWNKYLLTTIGFGEGVSYATRIPAEEFQHTEDQPKRLLNYLMLEITLAAPQYPNLQFIARLHHRSGGYGLFGAGNAGSNAAGFALRYRFDQPTPPAELSTPDLKRYYAGIMLGYAAISNKQNHDNGRATNHGKGARTNIYLGMGQVLPSKIFIGGEYFVDLGDTVANSDLNLHGQQLSQSFAYRAQTGFKFRLGYAFSPDWLFYTLAGIDFGRFRDQVTVNNALYQQQLWRPGFIYGFGLEYRLRQHLNLRVELNQTQYRHFTMTAGNTTLDEKPQAAQVNAGFALQYYL